jgi:hypothetical protein
LQAHLAAGPGSLKNQNLPSGDYFMTPAASTLIIERLPKAEFVEVLKNIELVFR